MRPGEDDLERVVGDSECANSGVPKPDAPLTRRCEGPAPADYCAACNTSARRCSQCAPGFELQGDGSCRNTGVELLVDFATAGPASRGADEDSSLEAAVGAAAGLPRSQARPLLARHGDASHEFQGAFRVAVHVPPGVSATELRMSLKARFADGVPHQAQTGGASDGHSRLRITGLRLTEVKVLCPGAVPANADGLCPAASLEAYARTVAACLFGIAALLVLGVCAFFWSERMYRKRELALLAAGREVQLEQQ